MGLHPFWLHHGLQLAKSGFLEHSDEGPSLADGNPVCVLYKAFWAMRAESLPHSCVRRDFRRIGP